VVIYHTEFDEFKEELERRKRDEELTSFAKGSIDAAIVKEFYTNLYDPEDKSPKQVQVRGHLIKFDEDTLNTFLKTPVIIKEGETLSTYSRFALLRPDPQELAAKLCIPGRGFELNADGQPLKILRKNMTTLAQTWSVLSYSNLVPTFHTSNITVDRAQYDSSRLGFPALITTLCKARGVTSDSRTLENLSPAINLAYLKKNCWNLDDTTVTFKEPRKARGKRSEAPPTSSTLPDPSAPSISTPHLPQFHVQLPASSAPALDFLFTPEMLHSMMQSLHRGQVILMQSFHSLGLPSIMPMEDFHAQVVWLGVPPSPSRGGGTSAAQEPDSAEPVEEHTEE